MCDKSFAGIYNLPIIYSILVDNIFGKNFAYRVSPDFRTVPFWITENPLKNAQTTIVPQWPFEYCIGVFCAPAAKPL